MNQLYGWRNQIPLKVFAMMQTTSKTTTEPVKAALIDNNTRPEFIRIPDATRLYGLKRGTIYNLIDQKRIRSVLLRVRGSKLGVRLIEADSIRQLIHDEMNSQQAA